MSPLNKREKIQLNSGFIDTDGTTMTHCAIYTGYLYSFYGLSLSPMVNQIPAYGYDALPKSGFHIESAN